MSDNGWSAELEKQGNDLKEIMTDTREQIASVKEQIASKQHKLNLLKQAKQI